MTYEKNKIFFQSVEKTYKSELEELEKLDQNAISYKTLSQKEIEELSRKIDSLPIEYKNIIFSRYSFEDTPEEAEKIFGVENPKAKLLFIKRLLSKSLGLDNYWIDDKSFKEGSDISLKNHTRELEEINPHKKPKYSRGFKKNIKKMGIKTDSTPLIMLKRVAVFFLIVGISFSLFLATNAQAREKFFNWTIETFEKYSIFRSEKIPEDYPEKIDIRDIEINYIPERFELFNKNITELSVSYDYSDSNNQTLYIILKDLTLGERTAYINTEGAEIKEIEINGVKGHYWERGNNERYLVWQKNGIGYSIMGVLSEAEIFKIAESITIEKNK